MQNEVRKCGDRILASDKIELKPKMLVTAEELFFFFG